MERKLSFSQRNGYRPIEDEILYEQLSHSLCTDIWNFLYSFWFDSLRSGSIPLFLEDICTDFLKQRKDKIPTFRSDQLELFQKIIFPRTQSWYVLYDFLEFFNDFLIRNPGRIKSHQFISAINNILENNRAGYRFVNNQIVPITDSNEIKAIQEATETSPYKEVEIHLTSALKFFSDKENPDFRNSIKESISAVEVFCRKITNESTLDRALKKLSAKGIHIPTTLNVGIEKLYHFTNGPEGIRHALMDEPTVGQAEAYFMLVACSSFINYLKTKQSC